MHLPRVYTIDEIAEYLMVQREVIEQEVASGRLETYSIGPHKRVAADDFEAYLKRTKNGSEAVIKSNWKPDAPFDQKWPDGTVEHYDTAFAATLRDPSGRERAIKVGFTNRLAAGLNRRRTLVLVDRYPTVEFVAANDFETSKLMTSIIKDGTKQIPVGGKLPEGYESLTIVRHRDYVDGSRASSNSAVLASADDLDAMAQHAMLRYLGRP